MKLEFLADGLPECPLIRLYGFSPEEARRLQQEIRSLGPEGVDRIHVHRLPFVRPLGGCKLTLTCRDRDEGVSRQGESAEFDCGLTAATWKDVGELIEPFTEPSEGYQWLTDGSGVAEILLSPSGHW